jgi:hypothetical protein
MLIALVAYEDEGPIQANGSSDVSPRTFVMNV